MEAYRKPPCVPPVAAEHHHGDKRRAWSKAFLEYAYALVDDPAYAGMPATRDAAGKLDWTIPSNRSPGSKNWNGNSRRRLWWEDKARDSGIPVEGRWLSRVAKAVHPWGWKPCQICGRWMRLSYSYPTRRTVAALNCHLPPSEHVHVTDYMDIYEVAEHMVDVLGLSDAVDALASTLPTLRDAPSMTTLTALQRQLEERVVRLEPRGRLSPGAMSNAPDRLDGFHTYNLCCRATQDLGRLPDNLRTYGVDRRAFEHWAEGDWNAANVLMSRTVDGICPRCDAFGPLSADHVGPISLGFQHTPFFEAVCVSCNSAKNNRMAFRDIALLRQLERQGVDVVSWHAAALWTAAKERVHDAAAALRLSKLLNVNQHEFLRLLLRARRAGIPDALLQFLSPEHAETRVEFVELDPETLRYTDMVRRPRQKTYSRSKAARLIRVAFEALDEYGEKDSRNVPAIPLDLLATQNRHVERSIKQAVTDASSWRKPLLEALDTSAPRNVRENRLHELIGQGFYEPTHNYLYIRDTFASYMAKVGSLLVERLDDDRAIKYWDTVATTRPPE